MCGSSNTGIDMTALWAVLIIIGIALYASLWFIAIPATIIWGICYFINKE
jgi:heme/copper-type cytochrome/quinol oxidase subunit 4